MPSIEKPAAGRAVVTKSATTYCVTLANRRLWLLLLSLCFGFVIHSTDNPWHRLADNRSGLLGVFWIIAAAILVLMVLVFIWSLLGSERLLVDAQTITMQNRLLGWPVSTTKLSVSEISGLWVEPLPEVSILTGRPQNVQQIAIQYGFGPGAIQLTANGKLYSFGRALDQAEANYLLGEVNDFLYRPRVSN